MDLKNTIFAILAIFCVVFSACTVCAAENVSNTTSFFTMDEAIALHEGKLPHGYAYTETQNTSDNLDAEAVHDNGALPHDYAHNEEAMMNATNATGNATHAAGENITTHVHHPLPATGNPILALLAVGAVFGGACMLRRK